MSLHRRPLNLCYPIYLSQQRKIRITGHSEREVNDMKKGLTEVVFILDRSGSMRGLEAETIGGYNSMLEKQQKEEGDAVISTILFDGVAEILHDRADLKKMEPITDKDYYVRGNTALLDALGSTIHRIGKIQKALPEDEKPAKTLFIITTDGMENASREYSFDKVKKMVEKKKAKNGWEFIFLGANIDAIEVAGRFGVEASRAVNFKCDSKGTKLNYDVLSKVVGCARACKSSAEMGAMLTDSDMFAEIREDFEERA